MIDEQKDLVRTKSKWTQQKRQLQAGIDALTEEISKHKEHFDSDVALSRDRFYSEVEDQVNAEYAEQVQDLTQRVVDLELQIQSIDVDEADESVREAIEKRD
jgi:hypothetical protein